MSVLLNKQFIICNLIFNLSFLRPATSAWPVLSDTHFQLIGIFPDEKNTNESTSLSVHSRAMFQSAILLSQQYNITLNGNPIGWHIIQTGGDIITALRDTCQSLLNTTIIGIVGPAFSREAHIIARFAKTIGIPVISYSATDPELSDRNAYPAFYRTVSSDTAAAFAIVKLFLRFNWTSCIVIYQNDAFGSGAAKVINDAFDSNNLIVREMILFDISNYRIQGDLKTMLRNSATRIVVVWAESVYTSIILKDGLDRDVVGPQFTWILSSTVPLDSFNATEQSKLIGILEIEPVPGAVVDEPINSTLLNAAYRLWTEYEQDSFPGENKVDSYGLFAFDATWTLIKSLEKICLNNMNNRSSCLSFVKSSFCFDYRFVESNFLYDAINSIKYLGVSGFVDFNSNSTNRLGGSYYIAQNIQQSSDKIDFVPVLKYNDVDGWIAYDYKSVVIWPGNSLRIPTGRANLDGITLRIGIIESPPFTTVTISVDDLGRNRTKYIGYIPDLIDELKFRMRFIADIQLVPSNKTYAALIEEVSNRGFDMLVGDVTITSSRREIVLFSNAIFENSLRLVSRKATEINVNLLSFLKPFSRYLWLLVLCAFVYAGLLFWLLERKDNMMLNNRPVLSQLLISLWYSFGNIVGYGVEFNATTAAGRVLTSGLYILSLLLVATYTANLASDLTILKSKDLISGIEDIKNGKIPFHRIGVRVGTTIEDFYLREISSEIKNYYPLNSQTELLKNLFSNEIDISFMESGTAEYLINTLFCNLTLIGTGFDKTSYGIAVPKDWLYIKDLDINILELRESGVLDSLRQKWFEVKYCLDSNEMETSMAVESMSGLFLVFGIISTLSVLLYTIQCLDMPKKLYSFVKHHSSGCRKAK